MAQSNGFPRVEYTQTRNYAFTVKVKVNMNISLIDRAAMLGGYIAMMGVHEGGGYATTYLYDDNEEPTSYLKGTV